MLDDLSPQERKEAIRKLAAPYMKRLFVVIVISVILAFGFNEISYQFQREASDRQPETVLLEIPAGTAKRVRSGETPPGIPSDLTFVEGDILEVVNKDSEPHNLGPLFIPASSAARLVMDNASKMSYTCSFRPNQYLGIDVRQATTLETRFTGLMLAAPTTAALLFLYSLIVYPVKVQPKEGSV